jgi:GT2 family glycosyltransferase
MDPDLSVIVVTHNGREMAGTTLRSAMAATGGADVEWIVVDSGSTDGTPDALEQDFPGVEVVRSRNRGFAAGNNVGLRRARGRYVLLLNPDVEIEDGSFAELVGEMDRRPEIGLTSVIHRGLDGCLQPSIRRFPSVGRDIGEALFAARWPIFRTLQELETRESEYACDQSVDWVVGAFLLARRDAIADVGFMDERFFLFCEEIDWCYRFSTAGWQIRHIPLMTIIHHAGRRDRGDLMAQLAYSRKLFAHKHFGALKSRGIRAALALGHVVRLVVHAPLALVSQDERQRVRAEARALAVQLGLAGAPRLGESASG